MHIPLIRLAVSHKQISRNLIVSAASFAISSCISFFLSPYLIRNLGVEAYGFFPLASSIFNYTTIITFALNSMAVRYIAIAEHQGQTAEAERYFNSVFFSDLVIACFLLAPSFVFAIYLDRFLDIPAHLVKDVKTLFLLVFLGSSITLAFSVYTSATFVKNRVDQNVLAVLFSRLVNVFITLVLFTLLSPNIAYLGVAFLGLVVSQTIFQILLKQRLLPSFRLDFRLFHKQSVLTLLRAGIWTSLGQIGAIFFVGLDLIIANMVLGATLSGTLAVAKIIPALILTLLHTLAMALQPDLVKVYAQNRPLFVPALKKSFLILTMLSAINVGGFIALGYDFYRLWIPEQDATQLLILSILTMLPTIANGGVYTLAFVFVITNKLAAETVVVLVLAVTNLLVVIYLLHTTTLGLYVIAGVSAFLEIIRRVVFWPLLTAKYCDTSSQTFYPAYFRAWACTGTTIVSGLVFRQIIAIDSWSSFIVVMLLTALAALAINAIIILSPARLSAPPKKLKHKTDGSRL